MSRERAVQVGSGYVRCDTEKVRLLGKNGFDEVLYVGPKAVGEGIGELAKLRELHIEETRIKQMPTSLANCSDLDTLRCIRNYCLKDVDCVVSSLTGIQALTFEECPLEKFILTTIPPSLVEVNLVNCKLSRIDESLCQILSMERLSLAKNAIQFIPPAFSFLRHLRHLCLSENAIEEFPEGVLERLSKLRFLNVNRNRLTAAFLLQLPLNLEVLDAERNYIETVPSGFSKLRCLIHVSLRENIILNVHPDILGMTLLQDLRLEGNPLQDPVFGEESRSGSHEVKLNPEGLNLLKVIEEKYINRNGIIPQER